MVVRATDKFIAQNRRARHDYAILDTLEAGIVLLGTEVKSLRQQHGSLQESYAGEMNGELYLFNALIPVYKNANRFNHEERRPRQLLVHRKERNRLLGRLKRDGITIVPLSMYFNDRGLAKVQIGLARGLNKGDKRAAAKEKDHQREQSRALRGEKD
ncbi:MAG: SsrA-binding protein SmpB [Alphaproteobacteria bacterium]|nr:SsrA-binding protein SmpB [Alphaproteobacteria bacterium]